jgi:ribosomal protein L14E/L6E/L27E
MCCVLVPLLQALVDGPFDITGVHRQLIPFKRLALTDIKVNILRNARQGTLKKAFAVSFYIITTHYNTSYTAQ